MPHINVDAADRILGDRFNVPSKGYVRLIDYMGGDKRILDVAKEHYGSTLPKVPVDAMDFLVHQRTNNRDVLGMAELKFQFEMPIREALTFVYAREANVNEYSLRYSPAQNEAHDLSKKELSRYIARSNKGLKTSEVRMMASLLSSELEQIGRNAFELYENLIDRKLANELARGILGENIYTRFYWKMNLADLLSFATEVDLESNVGVYAQRLINLAALVAPEAVESYLRSKGLENVLKEQVPDEILNPHLVRERAQEAESVLDKVFPVLGNGSVTLIDYMGVDSSVYNAARTSTGAEEKSKTEAENKGLINYLRRHKHTTPSEMVEFCWKIIAPMFVYRQGGRHRTFEKVLCDLDEEVSFYSPQEGDIALQSEENHQGRGQVASDEVKSFFKKESTILEERAMGLYKRLLSVGVPAKEAKAHLGVRRMVPFYFKTDSHNAFHYLGLRLDSHAQREIREPSEAMAQTVKAVLPWGYEAFERYQLNAMNFSSSEVPILRAMIAGKEAKEAYPGAWLKLDENGNLKPNRERSEFEKKLKRLKDEER